MIIKFRGSASVSKITKHIKDITEDIQKRANIEASSLKIRDAEIGICFMIDGKPMMLDTEHDGIKEPFTVMVQLDDKGNIEKKKDNEMETFLDKYSIAVAKGEEPHYKQIHTKFNWDDLELINTEHIDDRLKIKHYRHILTDEKVHQYYKDGILVGEYLTEN